MWSHRDTTVMQYIWLAVICTGIVGATIVLFIS
jgi:hypothetical protein